MANTDFGIFVNWNNEAFEVSVFVVPVIHLANKDQPMTPIITIAGYSGSDLPTMIPKTNE